MSARVLRSAYVWIPALLVALAIALLATVEPVRLAAHTVLGGLRSEPVEAQAAEVDAPPTAASGPPRLEPGTFQVTALAEVEALRGPVVELARALPFRALGIAAPPGYLAAAAGRALRGGAWTVRVDLEKLRRFVASSGTRLPLPPSRAAVDVQIRAGAALISTWRASDGRAAPLTLVQLQLPRVSAPPELDLERVTEALLREITPPVLWRQIDFAELDIIREILGATVSDPADGPPQIVALPNGLQAAVWRADGTRVWLMGPLDGATLVRLARAATPI